MRVWVFEMRGCDDEMIRVDWISGSKWIQEQPALARNFLALQLSTCIKDASI